MLPGEIVEELDLPGGPAPVAALPEAAVEAPWRRRLSGVRLIAAGWLVLVVVPCALAPVLPLPDPEAGQGAIAASPGSGHILGTDQLGRDILSRILWGGRTSFFVAALTTGIAMFLGLAFGISAGYFRRRIDWVIAGVADFVLAFPALILLIVITSVFGLSIRNLVLGLSILGTPAFVRIARAHAMTVSQREFVLAARGSGARNGRIMVRHILPRRGGAGGGLRADVRGGGVRGRGLAELPGPRGAAAHAELGRDDRGRAALARSRAAHRARAVDRADRHRAGAQLPRRPPGTARPPPLIDFRRGVLAPGMAAMATDSGARTRSRGVRGQR